MIARALPLAAALCLSACASTPTFQPAPPIERALPSRAMEPCPDLPLLANASTEEKSRWIAHAAPLYGSCSQRQEALAEWIKAGRPLK